MGLRRGSSLGLVFGQGVGARTHRCSETMKPTMVRRGTSRCESDSFIGNRLAVVLVAVINAARRDAAEKTRSSEHHSHRSPAPKFSKNSSQSVRLAFLKACTYNDFGSSCAFVVDAGVEEPSSSTT